MGARKRAKIEPTNEWELLVPLFDWPEQERYEALRPLVLFGESVAERAGEVGSSASTLYRRLDGFEVEGMESLFDAERAKLRKLPPAIKRLIVDMKAEYPAFNLNEIANICYVRFGRRLDLRTVKVVLEEEPIPLKVFGAYPPYHEIEEPRERRLAIVDLHAQGWSVKAIAGYLKINRDTVYKALRRWIEEGEAGLRDRKRGRPKGVSKVDLKAIDAVRRLQKNPHLGEFRVHAALAQVGINLSPRTCGRILAMNRKLYGYGKPKGGKGEKKEMPFASRRRHQFWSADVRYIDAYRLPQAELEGRIYVISILENHSRAILSSALTRSQDLSSFLSVLYTAVERYGSPESLVTDSGAIFRANRAKAIYDALNITKEEIERGKPWQSYIETTFNVQRRMADYHFARAESWSELGRVHEKWVGDYNGQSHYAHQKREDGRRSPEEVLGWLSGVRYDKEDLKRAFFSTRFARVLDAFGYARLMHWRIYGEEGLAGREAALWLQAETLRMEYAGQTLSHYEVVYRPATGSMAAKLTNVARPILYETSYRPPQLRLFKLEDVLGDTGWLKALKLNEYTPRRHRRPRALQEVLFSYLDAV